MKKHHKKAKYRPKKKPTSATRYFTCPVGREGLILSALLVFCIPVLLYLQTVNFKFVDFDDNTIITNNITFLNDLQNVSQAFTTDAFIDGDSHFYRPLQTISYMVDLQLQGKHDTWMFHLTNILLLGFIACLLFLILIIFKIPRSLAILSTLIYCAHPLIISNVAWIPARGDLLLMLFSLAAFLFLIEFLKKKSLLFLLLSWAAFTLALFSKETAAILPVVFIIYYVTFQKEKRFDNKYVLLIALYAGSGIAWFWIRSNAIGNFSNGNEVLDILSKNGEVGIIPFLLNLQTIPESLTNFFFPFDIDPIPNFSMIKTVIGSGIILLLGFLLFKNSGRPAREKIFCISWFLLLLAPTMLFKPYYFDYLHHRFFLPLIGMLLFVMFSFREEWFLKSKKTITWVMLALFLILSVSTFVKSRSYADPMTFYNSAIDNNPKSDFAYIHRGYLYQTHGRINKSISDFTKAIEINPDYAEAYNNRGIIYANQGQYDKAIKDYSKALKLKPNNVETYNNRGLLYVNKGLYTKAVADFNKVIELKPDLAEGYNNLGMAYGNQGFDDKAMAGFTQAIALKPDFAQAHNNLGMAYIVKGYKNKACTEFTKAANLGFKEAENNVSRFCK